MLDKAVKGVEIELKVEYLTVVTFSPITEATSVGAELGTTEQYT